MKSRTWFVILAGRRRACGLQAAATRERRIIRPDRQRRSLNRRLDHRNRHARWHAARVKPIDMSATPACVQANQSPVVPPIVVTGENGALANVVVYVKDGLGHYRFDTPTEIAVLRQKNCMYDPHVVALMTGQPFEIQNNDLPCTTFIRCRSTTGSGARRSRSDRPHSSLLLRARNSRCRFCATCIRGCGQSVFVFDHPYFAVTSTTGKFEMKISRRAHIRSRRGRRLITRRIRR